MKKVILIGLCIIGLVSLSISESDLNFRDENTVVNYLVLSY